MPHDSEKKPDRDEKRTTILGDDRPTRIAPIPVAAPVPVAPSRPATKQDGPSDQNSLAPGEQLTRILDQAPPPEPPPASPPSEPAQRPAPGQSRTTLVGVGPIQDFGGFGAEPAENAATPPSHAAPPHAAPPAPFGEAGAPRRRPVEPGATRLVWDTPEPEARTGHAEGMKTDTPQAEPAPGGIRRQDSPVVGWLVVTKGPGRGRSREIGYGISHIGRSPQARIPLDFGDGGISRERNATLTYDNRRRRFFLEKGEGLNPPFVNDDILISPVELKAGDTIQIADTHLRFVPLCGPDFEWQDTGTDRDSQAEKDPPA